MLENVEQIKLIIKECLRLLVRRDHSRKEIEQKLLNKGFANNLIMDVLHELADKNLQNDQRYAESYTRQRSNKGFGPLRIAYELQQKGIEKSGIAEMTQNNLTDWMTQLEQACRKKYASPSDMTYDERHKCKRFLLQRGFSSEMISAFFKQSTQPSN